MQYLGGKSRDAKRLAAAVSEYACPIGRCVMEVQTSAAKRLRQGAVERLFLV